MTMPARQAKGACSWQKSHHGKINISKIKAASAAL